MRVSARTDEALGDLMFCLSQYNFKIVYAQGKDNLEADALSRTPVLECFENEDDVLEVVNFVSIETIEEDRDDHQAEINKSRNIIRRGRIFYKKKRVFVSQELGRKLVDKVHSTYVNAHRNAINSSHSEIHILFQKYGQNSRGLLQ